MSRPVVCGQCGSPLTKPHCPSPTCVWISCQVLDCRFITGMVTGLPHAIPGKMGK